MKTHTTYRNTSLPCVLLISFLLTVASSTLLTTLSFAATFNVTAAAELQSVLTTAQSNKQNDTFHQKSGTGR